MKSKFLFVMGILLIIFGAVGIISNIVAMGSYVDYGVVGAGVVGIIESAIELIAGIFGVKKASDPAGVMPCVILSIIMIVLSIIAVVVMTTAAAYSGAAMIVGGIIGSLIIPVLYLIAALTCKSKASKA